MLFLFPINRVNKNLYFKKDIFVGPEMHRHHANAVNKESHMPLGNLI